MLSRATYTNNSRSNQNDRLSLTHVLSLVQQNFRELLDDLNSDNFDMNDGADKFGEG